MQSIVGMLLLDRIDLPPIGTISPWLDMKIRTEDEVFTLLEAQAHRRFIKTHTPLDGLPMVPSVTYICVVRHPLDVVLSGHDHSQNMREERVKKLKELRKAAEAPDEDIPASEEAPEDPGDYLRWFIDNHERPTGSGPNGLEDYCEQILTYWDAREAANVHLFHYADMWNDLDGQMRRVAAALGVKVDEQRWPAFVDAAGLASMRSRAAATAPDAHLGVWVDPERFFRSGGTRDWASLLSADDIAHFDERLRSLAEDAAGWATQGSAALPSA
jgi:aryl sulfotransferase